MLKELIQKKNLILVWVITIALLAFLAYFFAESTSNPLFTNEIDNIIFNERNQPAKYVLKLPNEENQGRLKANENIKKPQILKQNKKEVKISNPLEVAEHIPKLKNLEYVENNSNMKDSGEENNSKAWMKYRKKIKTHPSFFKVAIIVKRLGLSEEATETILKTTNSNVSLSFSPYAEKLIEYIDTSRKHGHETYMDVNITPKEIAYKDTGPKSINFSLEKQDNERTLKKNFFDDELHVGGFVFYGKVLEDEKEKMKELLVNIADSGHLIIDATTNYTLDSIDVKSLARNKADIIIDYTISKEQLINNFKKAENIARNEGLVTIIIEPKPLNIITLMEWIESFSKYPTNEEINRGIMIEKPFEVVPISALVTEI